MKKVCLGGILTLAVTIMVTVSCAGVPENQVTDTLKQESAHTAAVTQPEPEAEIEVPEAPVVLAETADTPPVKDTSTDAMVDTVTEGVNDTLVNVIVEQEASAEASVEVELPEPVLAEAFKEENPHEEGDAGLDLLPPLPEPEPVPPALAALPEPEPAPPALAALPEPEPEVPAFIPQPVPPESPPLPPPVESLPQPPEVVEQPPVEEEEAPAVVREPVPRVIPELPRPAPGITGLRDEQMVFSRVVRATAGQLVEIPFRGTGWVYLGETGALRGILYDSRRLDPEGQSFIFRTELAGIYALKFYRQDFIHDFILNDYVQVIVGDPHETAGTGWFNPSADQGRIIAEPRWPASLAEAQARGIAPVPASPPENAVAASDTATVSPTPEQPPASAATPEQSPAPAAPVPVISAPSPSAPNAIPEPQPVPAASVPESNEIATPQEPAPVLSHDDYVTKAKEEYEAGRIDSALALLDQFRKEYPQGSDEILWLYGQFYEANSSSRNILTALDCYRRLVRDYPQSSRTGDARRRISYLERYYINIQ